MFSYILFKILVCICLFGMSAMALNTCNILSLSGGGSFGAVEAGILKKIALPEYDLIAGVSAGGLNAGFLSYYNHDQNFSAGVDHLIDTYSGLTDDMVYKHSLFQLVDSWSYYSTAPLADTITKNLQSMTTTVKKPTLIGATNLNSGKLDIFNFASYDKDNQKDILLASSAIPLVLEPIKYNNNLYVDGGTISNEILYGFEEYLIDNKCNNYNITFISAHQDLAPADNINHFVGYVERLINVFMSTFDNELVKFGNLSCPQSKIGDIYHYFPTGDLSKFSMLDFTSGKEMIDISYNNNDYIRYDYCGGTQGKLINLINLNRLNFNQQNQMNIKNNLRGYKTTY